MSKYSKGFVDPLFVVILMLASFVASIILGITFLEYKMEGRLLGIQEVRAEAVKNGLGKYEAIVNTNGVADIKFMWIIPTNSIETNESR